MSDKELIRTSVIGHLEAIQSYGLSTFFSDPKTIDLLVPTEQAVPIQTEVIKNPTADTCVNPLDLNQISSLSELQVKLEGCARCPLHTKRKTIVFGSGNSKARLMFIGEGPGADEDEQGLPFVGAAGQLLTKIIEAMQLKREDVYIANIVKCRPPNNRNPEDNEIKECLPFLKKQIELIKPKAIICLGKFAAQTLLETRIPISRLRGTFQELNEIQVMPSFHPAYLLRNASMKRLMWEDCKKVMEFLKKTENS